MKFEDGAGNEVQLITHIHIFDLKCHTVCWRREERIEINNRSISESRE